MTTRNELQQIFQEVKRAASLDFALTQGRAKMNYNELKQLCKQLSRLGVQTVGQLAALLKKHGISGNDNIINFVNEIYIKMEA